MTLLVAFVALAVGFVILTAALLLATWNEER